jgi:methanogenic corrinoid protein MtbC1
MSSFPSALKSVFGGMASPYVSFPATMARTWPLLRLASPRPAPHASDQLAKVVESEIIPRLMVAHKSPHAVQEVPSEPSAPIDLSHAFAARIDAEAAEAFVRMLLSRGTESLMTFVETLIRSGVSVQAIYADLLTPTARLLGDLWDQDRVSYTEVTIALGRLQQLVHGLDWLSPYNGENDPGSRSVMFAPRPGEQQTFGFYIMEELFRWSGWRAWIETCATNAQMVANVQFRWFDMVCLSVCRDTNIEEVSTTIKGIRRASRNQDLFVLVHGRPFVEHAELVETVGADAAASCASEALTMADNAVWRGD